MPITFEEAQEPPEVAALKERVVTVARKYADRHGWCDVVNQALAEAGLVGPPEVRVDITFRLPGGEEQHAIQTFRVEDLHGKTPEEMNAWVAEMISPEVRIGTAPVMKVPVEVIDLDLVSNDPSDPRNQRALHNGLMLPGGFQGAILGWEGRVTHIWESREHDQAAFVNATRTPPLCGAEVTWAVARVHSNRDEGRFCARCQRAMQSRLAARS